MTTFHLEGSAEYDSIVLSYRGSGEYQNRVLLKTVPHQKTLFLSEMISPLAISHNDKLGAHKVIATSLRIKIPSQLPIQIELEEAETSVFGTLEALEMVQNKGKCTLHGKVAGTLQTAGANVAVLLADLPILAKSLSGDIAITKPSTSAMLQISTISGNIHQP